MSEIVDELLTTEQRAGFELTPAMECLTFPEWSGARWIGLIDLDVTPVDQPLRLLHHEGYERARLLVRQGTTVRGFVDVEILRGSLEPAVLKEAIAGLPTAAPHRDGSTTPFISVIVCTRDRATQLRQALATILALEYPNFEVVVVDNAGRTSETSDMVRNEFNDPRVTLIAEPVPGLSRARNAGLREARGDIVAFTDDDVVVDAYWLREIAAGFERAPGTACVTGLVPAGELRSPAQGYFDGRVSWSKSTTPKVFSLAEPPADLPKFPFSPGVFGTGANFALDRLTALRLGGFDTALGVGSRTGGGEDIDMFSRVILAGCSLVVQPSAIVWHRHRDGLPDLLAQARGYGNGLGAWMTKILLDPRTSRLALARSTSVAREFLLNRRRAAATRDEDMGSVDPELAKVQRTELLWVARGPLNYVLARGLDTGRAP